MNKSKEFYEYLIEKNFISNKVKYDKISITLKSIELKLGQDEKVCTIFSSKGIYKNGNALNFGETFIAFTNNSRMYYCIKSFAKYNVTIIPIETINNFKVLNHDSENVEFEIDINQSTYKMFVNENIILNLKNEMPLNFRECFIIHEKQSETVESLPTKESLSTEDIFNKQISNSILSVVDEINQLKELKDKGAITQEEFNSKKKQLLGI